MAHHVEPMDIDSDFDNKENSLHHNNVLPFTEKGYEELDVSELNMKLRYSVTPASSPMSKSYTANCPDNRNLEASDDTFNVTVNDNTNLTRSLNSTLTKNANVTQYPKVLPLQSIPSEQYVDNSQYASALRPLDTTVTADGQAVNITLTTPSDLDENASLPSSLSSPLQTPEATTPTKDITVKDGGSPIMRGLKTVLNMFRSSQSPIPTADNETVKPDILSPVENTAAAQENATVNASTPISAHRKKEMSPTKRNSPAKDNSIVFNEDLEKELQWKDETTIIFSQERIPIHKLLFQQSQNQPTKEEVPKEVVPDLNTTTDYMDISYNDSIMDKTVTDNKKADITGAGESDCEFEDCETTFSKNDTKVMDDPDKLVMDQTQNLDITTEIENKNESGSRLKQIILDTTQDILDATLSVRPEDLLPEFDQTKTLEVLINKPILYQTVDMMKSLQDNIVDPNATKTIESKTGEVVKPFDATITLPDVELPKANLHMTKTIENALNHTQVINNEINNTITNETITLDSNETFDVNNLPANSTQIIENALNQTQVINQLNDEINTTITNETMTLENKTFDVNNLAANSTQIIEKDMNPTQVLNQCNNELNAAITKDEKILENKTFDVNSVPANSTQIIEKDMYQTQVLNQSNNEMNATITNETITLENNTFDVNNLPANSTQIILKDLNQTQVLNQFSTEINTVTNETVTLDNKTVDGENLPTLDAENKSVEPNLEAGVNILEVIQGDTTDNIVLDVTITSDKQTDDADNLNATITNESLEKTYDGATALPYIEVKESDVIEETNMSAPVDTQIIDKGKVPVLENIQETTNVLSALPTSEVKQPTVIEASMTELPVDVPLPDEDDLALDFDPTLEKIPENLPLDLVENIKLMEELHDAPIQTNELLANENLNVDINSLPACVPVESTLHTDVDATAVPNNPMPIMNNETENVDLLNKMSAANIMADVIQEAADKSIEHPNPENIFENIETVTHATESAQDIYNMSIDISHTEADFHPLPDIINQAMTAPENTELAAKLTKALEIGLALQINEIETNVVSTMPVDEANKVLEPELPAVSTEIFAVPEKLSCEEVLPANNVENPKNTETQCDSNEANTIITETALEAPTTETKVGDEEIVLSENNSPFVSVIAEDIPVTEPKVSAGENQKIPANTSNVIAPSSPPIQSKGYNFNFDDVDFNPFATKTTIRMSPPLNTPKDEAKTHSAAKKDNNRRKPQTEKKKPAAPRRKLNSTFDGVVRDTVVETPPKVEQLDPPVALALNLSNVTIEEKAENVIDTVQIPEEIASAEPATVAENKIEQSTEEMTKVTEEITKPNDLQQPSSSEQSVYFSPCASSSENSNSTSKNVFNIPEIDDMNFNPFATKSKMRQSPPPTARVDDPFATNSKLVSSPDSSISIAQEANKNATPEDKIETELMEKDVSSNLSNTTVSSKGTDERNATTREVNTEDEDTIEGPFLENDYFSPEAKTPDFNSDNIDMMEFNELPTQNQEENLDTGEMFIDAEAFEFLLNQNKGSTVADSGKESLFLKFDPLFAKRMSAVTSDGVLASLARLQKRQSTPTKAARTPQKKMSSPVPGPSNVNATQDMDMSITEAFSDDLNVTVSKPMMAVPPAVNPVTPRNKSITPNRTNRRSFTFTSPAMAVIDRLLSLSGNNSMINDTTVTQAGRDQSDADIALTQLRELLAEKEIAVYNLKSESNDLRDRLNTLEGHVRNLEVEGQNKLKKINELNNTLIEKTKINKSMAAVVEEYERTIATLISGIAEDKKKHAEERLRLINERDEQTAHLASMEVSFGDLHSKYEKSKQVILNCKANEELYKKSIKEFEESLSKMEKNYELLKQHATSKLNHANQELEKMNRSHEAEILKLNAMIKRKDLHITSLEESLAQKTKANEELTAICDELINKVA